MSNSTKKPLQVKDLTISDMPGFPSGMKPFEGFSEGINIIAGPNASGKSTTAQAIQKLIWQNDTNRIKLSGHAGLNGDTWTLRVNSGQKIVQRNGVADEISGVPAAEEQNRYMLALHKLMTADGKELAKQIIRESVGGYDPENAAENLNYSQKVSTTGIRSYKDFQSAEKAVRESQQVQKNIKAEEEKLSDLLNQKEDAEASKKKADFYQAVIEIKKAERNYADLKAKFESFPEVLEQAHGEELSRVEELENEILKAEENIRSAQKKIDESNRQLSELSIPETGVPGTVLGELEERISLLEVAERDLKSIQAEKEGLEFKRSEKIKRLGENADPEKLRQLDLQDIGDLDEFLEKAHRLASEKRLTEQEIADLQKEGDTLSSDSDTIREGISQLSYWLKEVSEKNEFPKWVIFGITALVIVSLIAGYFIPLAGAVGLIIILFLAIYGWTQLSQTADTKTENIRIDDFEKTGLKSPAEWNPEDVSQRLDDLISELRESRWKEKVSSKLVSSQKRLDSLNSRIMSIEEKKSELIEKLSVLPEMPFDNPESYSQVAWYISAVQKWQEADANLRALTEKLGETRHQFETELSKVSELIKPYTNDTVHDAAEAKSIFKELTRQEDSRARATDEIKRQESAISNEQEILENKTEDLASVYEKFGLEAGENDRLRQLIEQLESYRSVSREYERAKDKFEETSRSLREHSLFDEEKDHISEMTIDQAEELLKKLQADAEQLDQLNREIVEIETRVETVKSGNSLEKALAERDQAVENLRDQYEENLQKITGQLLTDTIKKEMREQNRPKVFREANRIFNRITKGRYELEIDEKDRPDFRAFDTVEGIGRSLDKLSSGTRIQLLLAVRLAFVETQETSIKLPILADELLANSDDIRAEAIIEALTEISRDGRQVFYFTAQGDEVAKWNSYLKQKGINDHKVFYLTDETSDELTPAVSESPEPVRLVRQVTEPGLQNHRQYGETLNFPAFDLLRDNPGRLHLWYLIENPELLHAALSAGIDYWGSLKSYLHAGGGIKGLEEEHVHTMEEKTDLLERYLQLYRQGRPRPIDRSVLEASGAVSDKFIDSVTEKLNELNNNPEDLLAALRKGEISRFLTNKIEELEAYLLEKGYLDDREPMDDGEITIALHAFISNLSLSKTEAQDFLNQFMR